MSKTVKHRDPNRIRWNTMDSESRYQLLREIYPDSLMVNKLAISKWRQIPSRTQPVIAQLLKSADNPLEPDFCVCDYRPRRKCSVHPEALYAGQAGMIGGQNV